MIISLLVAAAASTTGALPTPSSHELLAGAEHAVRANRLDQASLMIGRAVGAGASGPELEHVLADLDFASGKYAEALARYDALLERTPDDQSLLEPAGISALKLGQVQRASLLLSRATSMAGASWRAWNALGVVADLRSDWASADDCYDHAARLAPDEVEPVNNRGWSLLLRGRWKDARDSFERAAAMDSKSARIANNLELARTALDTRLPQRRAGESDSEWAGRLNDAGVAAAILGDRDRAAAAFTEAVRARGTWYARAANNLEALRGR
jgi:Flp pilus assembly protein TadD